MRPIVHRLKTEFAGRVKITHVQYSDRRMRQVVAQYGADFHPAFAFVSPSGQLAQVLLGEVDSEHLERGLQLLLDGLPSSQR